MSGRLTIQHRIVIPFALVAIVTMSGAALLARLFFSRTQESRLVAQVRNAADVLGQSDYALNTQILKSARQIAGTDIITYSLGGEVLATTLDARQRASLVRTVATSDAARDALARADGSILVRWLDGDAPSVVAYKRVPAHADTVVAVIVETSELAAANRAITRTLLLATTVSLLLMILVSQAVARRVTAPLDALVAFAQGVSPEGSARRAPAGDDEIGRMAAAFNDMLDRLDESRHALVQSEKLGLAGLMAARVAHEIRNPLSAIKMQVQLLGMRHGADATVAPHVTAVLHNVEQVESVVRDLIELARPGELARRPTSLKDVVLDVLRQMLPQLTYRKIDVRQHIAGDLPLVDLDEGRFRQALLNIVGNAADAMPTGGTLQVVVEVTDHGRTLTLDVIDDGVGIDPAIRDRLFDAFVSTKRDGVGLGLVNAKAVVENHGGRIALTAASPRGTVARITLPVTAIGTQEPEERTYV
jgi:signal transduction histidine kinase